MAYRTVGNRQVALRDRMARDGDTFERQDVAHPDDLTEWLSQGWVELAPQDAPEAKPRRK